MFGSTLPALAERHQVIAVDLQGQVNAAAAEFLTDTPMDQLYQRVAPRPEDFPRLLDKIGEAMATDFDW
jgi:hypothetical protein